MQCKFGQNSLATLPDLNNYTCISKSWGETKTGFACFSSPVIKIELAKLGAPLSGFRSDCFPLACATECSLRAWLREFNSLGLQLRPDAAKLVTRFLQSCEATVVGWWQGDRERTPWFSSSVNIHRRKRERWDMQDILQQLLNWIFTWWICYWVYYGPSD